MKQFNYILFIAIITLVINTTSTAQELWLNEDFSSTEWSFALEEAGLMHPLSGEVVEIAEAYWTFPFKPDTYGDVEGTQGFYLNGHWSGNWIAEPQTGLDGRSISHSIRLRGNNPSFIQLPKLSNAGKIAVYVRNSNATTNTSFNIEKLEDDNTTWTNLSTMTTPGSNLYNEGEFEHKLEYEVNSATPVSLRVYKNTARFLNFYKVSVEKYASSGIKGTLLNQMHIDMQGKTLHINTEKNGLNHIQLLDLSGRLIWQVQSTANKIHLPASLQHGMYVIRIVNNNGYLNKSILIE